MTPFAGVGLVLSFLSNDLLLNKEQDVVQSFEDESVMKANTVKV